MLLSELHSARRREKVKNFLGNVGLIGFMIGLYYHTFSFFSVFFDSWFIGHCVALAVDASTYAALFRRRELEDTGELGISAWIIFSLCFITSLFTNFHESFLANYSGAEMTLASIKSLDIMQKIRLSIGSFVPPLLMFLSLVLASGKSTAAAPARSHNSDQGSDPEKGSGYTPIELANQGKSKAQKQRAEKIAGIVDNYPDMTEGDQAKLAGVSVKTLRKYKQEFSGSTNGYY